jgi:hypothetical protein
LTSRTSLLTQHCRKHSRVSVNLQNSGNAVDGRRSRAAGQAAQSMTSRRDRRLSWTPVHFITLCRHGIALVTGAQRVRRPKQHLQKGWRGPGVGDVVLPPIMPSLAWLSTRPACIVLRPSSMIPMCQHMNYRVLVADHSWTHPKTSIQWRVFERWIRGAFGSETMAASSLCLRSCWLCILSTV